KSSYNNWTYVALTPTAELTNKADKIRNLTWIMVALLVLFWGFISFLSYRRLYMPIYRIIQKLPRVMKPDADDVQMIHSYVDDVTENNNKLKIQLHEQQLHVREHLLKTMIYGEASADALMGKLKQYDLLIEGKTFYLCIIDVDQVNQFKQKYQNNDRNLV